MYVGYKHWTTEETPRCFYVGKGRKHRPYDRGLRSKKWKAVVNRYGLRVEICVGPLNDEEARAWEITTISDMGTFTSSYSTQDGTDIRCNFTFGGDGASGYRHTEEHKQHMSQTLKGHVGYKFSVEQRRQMSIDRKGVPKKSKENYGKHRMRVVQQLDEFGNVIAEFESATQARKFTGVSCAAISLHCQGKRQLQRWRFKLSA